MSRKVIEIVPMVIPGGTKGIDSHIIDLKIDDITIESGKDPFRSYDFWEQMRSASNRALYRLKKLNSLRRLDVSFANFGSTPQEQKDAFLSNLKNKYPSVDRDKVLLIIESKFKGINSFGDIDGHPNPEMMMPLDSDINKAFIFSVIEEINK